MFIGNAGQALFIIALILYIQAAMVAPSIWEATVIIVSLLLIFLVIRLRFVERLGDIMAGDI